MKLSEERPLNNLLSEDGYEIENNAMEEWLETYKQSYSERLLDGKKHYCVEYYDERFNGDEADSIVEIWIPIISKPHDKGSIHS